MIIGLDTETTGLSVTDDEILQISIVDRYGAELVNEYVQPKHHTEWPEAEAVNHISPAQVQDLATIDVHIQRIIDLLEQSEKIVGYNTEFDLGFLAAAAGKDDAWLERMQDKSVDVMREFAEVYGEWNEKHEAYRLQKLTTCAEHYGYTWPSGPHDSLEDAKATIYCWPRVSGDLAWIQAHGQLTDLNRLSDAELQSQLQHSDHVLQLFDSALEQLASEGRPGAMNPMGEMPQDYYKFLKTKQSYRSGLHESLLNELAHRKQPSLADRLADARQQAANNASKILNPPELSTYLTDGYALFYEPEPARALQQQTGWNLAWGSENHNLNGDTWIVYRSASDLPKPLQRVVPKLEHEAISGSLSDCLKAAQQQADITNTKSSPVPSPIKTELQH